MGTSSAGDGAAAGPAGEEKRAKSPSGKTPFASKHDHISKEYFDEIRRVLEQDCEQFQKRNECHQLAEFYQSVDKDYKRAAAMYQSLCDDRNYGPSCTYLGTLLMTGRGVDQNFQAAYERFTKACELESPEGCQNAGMILRAGAEGVPQDRSKAVEYFQRACDDDLSNGCFMLSTMLLQGKEGVKKDMAGALKYAERACELGHPWGCINAAKMCATGDGVPKDEKKADEFKQLATELMEAGADPRT